MRASLPPHSASTGVRFAAAAAMTLRAVAAEPVNAILSSLDAASAAPVSPSPVTICSTGCVSPNTSASTSANESTSHAPVPVVSSLGLNTTALPAASAYPIDPIGVNTG